MLTPVDVAAMQGEYHEFMFPARRTGCSPGLP